MKHGALICLISFASFGFLLGESAIINNASSGVDFGVQKYGKEEVRNVNLNGMVTLDGTKVAFVQVNGSLNATDAEIGQIHVNGMASLTRCHIKQKTEIIGLLVASHSRFYQEVFVSSDKVIIDSCVLPSLRILNTGEDRVQVVELRGNAVIQGAVVFESGHGEVITTGESKIGGEITGGKVRK